MVRALIDGRKTQTRRVIKPQPSHDQVHRHKGQVTYDGMHRMWCWQDLVVENLWDFPGNDDRQALASRCPYGKVGDRLWCRETFNPDWCDGHVIYRADSDSPKAKGFKWKPAIFMPRSASRLTLELTGVRVERLHEISEADAQAEGIPAYVPDSVIQQGPAWFRMGYHDLWNQINGKGSWDANPFVWALTFSVHKQNIDKLAA